MLPKNINLLPIMLRKGIPSQSMKDDEDIDGGQN